MNCLDTSFLVDVLRGAREARSRMEELEGRQAIAAVSGVELWIGAHLGSVDEYRQAEQLLDTLLWLPLSRDIAKRTGELHADLAANGTPLAFNDCVIAATALEHGLALVCRDVDFERVDKLEVKSY